MTDAFTANPPHDSELVAGIQTALDELAAAWNAGDLDHFVDAYSDDSQVRYISGSQIAEGRDAIRNRYADRFGASQGPGTLGYLSLTITRLRPLSDRYIYVIARFELRDTSSQEPARGIATMLMIRCGEAWKILEDHSS